jgi:hypothetical protein
MGGAVASITQQEVPTEPAKKTFITGILAVLTFWIYFHQLKVVIVNDGSEVFVFAAKDLKGSIVDRNAFVCERTDKMI